MKHTTHHIPFRTETGRRHRVRLLFMSVLFGLLFLSPSIASAHAGAGHLIDSIRSVYAPDRRVELFSIKASGADSALILTGETTSGRAYDALLQCLGANGYRIEENDITLLPDSGNVGERAWAIVNVSACNLRSEGDYNAPQSSQALLGMPLRVIRRDGWLQVQTPDGYIAWVLPSTVQRVTAEALGGWNTSPQIVVTALYGFVYSRPDAGSQTVGDVCAGDRLKFTGHDGHFYQVEYPDGRRGFISPDICREVNDWRKTLRRDGASIVSTARRLMGLPYMWGGTSTKGVDCSGFVRTTLLQHDIIIPRDASQQACKGRHIEIDDRFDSLRTGDLLFFGRKATDEDDAHVSHVGIYIGSGRFIHSLGYVHESSFRPEDEDYDAYDLKRLLWAQRVLPYINKEDGLLTTDRHPFYSATPAALTK